MPVCEVPVEVSRTSNGARNPLEVPGKAHLVRRWLATQDVVSANVAEGTMPWIVLLCEGRELASRFVQQIEQSTRRR